MRMADRSRATILPQPPIASPLSGTMEILMTGSRGRWTMLSNRSSGCVADTFQLETIRVGDGRELCRRRAVVLRASWPAPSSGKVIGPAAQMRTGTAENRHRRAKK
jgi:hypothetical protein